MRALFPPSSSSLSRPPFLVARSRRGKSSFSVSSSSDDGGGEKFEYDASLEKVVPDVEKTSTSMIKSTTLNVKRRFQVDVKRIESDDDESKSPTAYCKLPASQYNVIDEDKVEMVDDGRAFVVSTGVQKFLFLTVEAKGRVEIEETESGVKQTLEKAEMIDVSGKNGKIVDAMNKSIGCVRVVNSVMATTSGGGKEHHIESQLEFSGTFTEGVFAKIGPRLNEIASFVLGATLPWFLETIGKDYELWSTGGERRKAKMDIGGMSQAILKGAKGKLPSNVREIEVV
jgi:hypothetical protein